MNIKNILALKFTAIIAIILLVFSVFVYQFSKSLRENEFNERLKTQTEKLASTLLDSSNIDLNFVLETFKYDLNLFPNQSLIIKDQYDNFYFNKSHINEATVNTIFNELKGKKEFNMINSDTDYVGFNLTVGNTNYQVITSGFDELGQSKLNFLLLFLLSLFFGSLIITAFLGRTFASQALLPIINVINQVEKISENNLYERVSVGPSKDEIAQLAITFNQMLERLDDSFKLQKTFVSNASHEFRTPLTVMKGQIEVLLLQPRSNDIYIKTFLSLIDDINNQIQLINGLSDLAKANANFPNTSFGNVSVIELLDECSSELTRTKRHKIVVNIDDLPDDEYAHIIRGNAALLKSAIMNVMDNACKFSEDKSCQVTLNCSHEVIKLDIIDQGVGISEDDLKHVFEPFYRSNNIRHINGYGIGLSLVKKIVEWHFGKIKVNSKLGEGTHLSILLPSLRSNANLIF